MASAEQAPPPELMSALVTEHFVLQSAATATISEASSRAALFLSALASGLVALGFASGSPEVLMVLTLTVLPTVFVLGCVTIVRLVDTSIENIVASRRIERIRSYYASLHPLALPYFGEPAAGSLGIRYTAWSMVFTMTSVISLVDAVVAGGAVAVGIGYLLHPAHGVSVAAGVLAGAIALAVFLVYQHRRLRGFARHEGDA